MAKEKNASISSIHEMVTLVGTSLFTEEKVVAQSDAMLIGSMVETFIIEFD